MVTTLAHSTLPTTPRFSNSTLGYLRLQTSTAPLRLSLHPHRSGFVPVFCVRASKTSQYNSQPPSQPPFARSLRLMGVRLESASTGQRLQRALVLSLPRQPLPSDRSPFNFPLPPPAPPPRRRPSSPFRPSFSHRSRVRLRCFVLNWATMFFRVRRQCRPQGRPRARFPPILRPQLLQRRPPPRRHSMRPSPPPWRSWRRDVACCILTTISRTPSLPLSNRWSSASPRSTSSWNFLQLFQLQMPSTSLQRSRLALILLQATPVKSRTLMPSSPLHSLKLSSTSSPPVRQWPPRRLR